MKYENDIVYILGTQSKWADNEIRFSLRSLGKIGQERGRIFIVGAWPKWMDPEMAIHIPAEDRDMNKLVNAIEKIKLACKDERISETFLLMNDDFFFLKRTRTVRSYHMGLLKNAERRHETKAGYYFRAIVETRRLLLKKGIKNPLSYEVHYPMELEKKKFLKMARDLSGPYLFRSVYGNLFKVPAIKTEDFKAFNLRELARLEDGMFLSIDNKLTKEREFRSWITARLRGRSKYERTRPERWVARQGFTYGNRFYNKGDIVPGDLPEIILRENAAINRKKKYN